MSGPVVFHTYRDREISLVGNPIKAVRRETFCGGEWHTTGRAPCELQDADDAAALDLSASCAVDAADIEAAKELLGLSPRVTVCRFKGRASWQDKNLPPHTQWCRTHGELWRKTAEGCDVGLRKGATRDCSTT